MREFMSIRVAIPEPTSFDTAYNQRSLPQYLAALHSAGLTPVVVPLHESKQRVAKLLSSVQGVLLPGSGADVDSQKYGAAHNPLCAEPDSARAAVDELMIRDAFNLHKPVLGICYGTQSLNVWCGGTLIQDIPSEAGGAVDHAPGRHVNYAHSVVLTPGTRLQAILEAIPAEDEARVPGVNSSHHQAIRDAGEKLIISAVSPEDGVIEAVEWASTDRFVVAVQWHPERTYVSSPFSRAIFAAFARAVEAWTPCQLEECV
jgi:putative glutamine amidotransferase